MFRCGELATAFSGLLSAGLLADDIGNGSENALEVVVRCLGTKADDSGWLLPLLTSCQQDLANLVLVGSVQPPPLLLMTSGTVPLAAAAVHALCCWPKMPR